MATKWFRERFRKYDLFAEYFATLKETWVDVAFGTGVPAIIFVVLWSLAVDIPRWAVVLFLIWAHIVAGYFGWLLDHVRLIPKLEFGEVRVVKTPTTETIGPVIRPGPERIVAKILVRLATEATVTECRGQLLRVWKWRETEKHWVITDVDEPVDLLWSTIDQPVRTLTVDHRLCIFNIDNLSDFHINLWAERVQHRMVAMFEAASRDDIFKFDISVSGKDCPSIEASIRVCVGDQWDSPRLGRIY